MAAWRKDFEKDAKSLIRFHRFLDVDSHKVDRTIDGLCDKYTVHSKADTADTLRSLVGKFLDLPVTQEKQCSKSDTHYAVLSLLLCLSETPTSLDYQQQVSANPQETSPCIRATASGAGLPRYRERARASALQRAGQAFRATASGARKSRNIPEVPKKIPQNCHGNRLKLGTLRAHIVVNHDVYRYSLFEGQNPWSEDEDDDDDDKDDSSDDNTLSTSNSQQVSSLRKDFLQCAEQGWLPKADWLKNSVMVQYWSERPQTMELTNTHHTANLTNIWEMHQYNSDPFYKSADRTPLTEAQTMRESLWVLGGCQQSFLYRSREQKLLLMNNIKVSHITPDALQSILQKLAWYGDITHKLHHMIDSVITRSFGCHDNGEPSVSRTQQAFTSALLRCLQDFNKKLAALEKRLVLQEELITLSTMMGTLQEQFGDLEMLYTVYQLGVVSPSTDKTNDVLKASRLLSVLYQNILQYNTLGDAANTKYNTLGDAANTKVCTILKASRLLSVLYQNILQYNTLGDAANTKNILQYNTLGDAANTKVCTILKASRLLSVLYQNILQYNTLGDAANTKVCTILKASRLLSVLYQNILQYNTLGDAANTKVCTILKASRLLSVLYQNILQYNTLGDAANTKVCTILKASRLLSVLYQNILQYNTLGDAANTKVCTILKASRLLSVLYQNILQYNTLGDAANTKYNTLGDAANTKVCILKASRLLSVLYQNILQYNTLGDAANTKVCTILKASRLLSVLYQNILQYNTLGDAANTKLPLLLPLWIQTLRPYLEIIDGWVNKGNLIDPAMEFIIQRNGKVDVFHEDFWESAFLVSCSPMHQDDTTESSMKEDGQEENLDDGKTDKDTRENQEEEFIPVFLKSVFKEIILAGKSMELLKALGKMGGRVEFPVPLYEEFVQSLQTFLEVTDDLDQTGSSLCPPDHVGPVMVSSTMLHRVLDTAVKDSLLDKNFLKAIVVDSSEEEQDETRIKPVTIRCRRIVAPAFESGHKLNQSPPQIRNLTTCLRLQVTRISSTMFNNGSHPWMLPEETYAPEFTSLLGCYRWHLQNNTASIAQADEACSMHEDLVRLGTGTDIVFSLIGLIEIIANAVVILGIIGTKELRKPIYFFLANLAMADVFAGIGLLYRTVGHVGHNQMYDFSVTYLNFLIFSQMTSASALSLLSINSYVGVRHPIYFHIHANSAKLRAVVAMIVSWIIFSLIAFSPSMGWNCLHMETLTTGTCTYYFPQAYIIMCLSIMFLMCMVMLFTNISVYVAIRDREKRRLEQAGVPPGVEGENGPVQNIVGGNQPNNAAQEEALRKYEARVYRSRTVMIYVVVAFVFWLVPLLLMAVCSRYPSTCARWIGPEILFSFYSLNSIINPMATLIRTEELRNAIWQKMTGIHQTLVTAIRGNRVDPQGDQAGTGDPPNLQEGSAHGEGQNTPGLAPDDQPQVGNQNQAGTGDPPNLQEGSAHGEGQNTPGLAPDDQPQVGNQNQAGTGDPPNLQEGSAHGEGQNTPGLAPEGSQPVQLALQRCLYPHILQRCSTISRLLVELLKTEYQLEDYLQAMQKFFLMEAGDAMHNFYMPLFAKLSAGEEWQDVSVLNSQLHSAIQQHHNLRSPDVQAETDQPEESDDIPARQKEHRMHLLRLRLLHFINALHSYFMTRILYTTALEFRKEFSEASDLSRVVEAHTAFLTKLYQRCMLHKKAGLLKMAVRRMLNMAVSFQTLWDHGLHNISLEALETIEDEFKKCNDFLGSFFINMSRRGSFPHMESLALSLRMGST
uniref:G-protein coupled receptors family 1 profile domain-containing protein n=1 Tax=Branchiostoma floridae TaxID=7739 RepID=C3ZYG0_BRAFL|eukprot:XP_002586423.1 hypothetical protein BRAFLDRAFT_107702 [Branchiostoma floridae]